MRFSDFPRAARFYIVSVCAFALALTVVAASQSSNGTSLQFFGLLVLAATIAHSFPVSTPGKQAYHVSLPFFVAGMILLSPLQLVALMTVVHLAESVRGRRRSTAVQIFNTAAYVLTGIVAQAIYRTLWPGTPDVTVDLSQPACLAAGLAA